LCLKNSGGNEKLIQAYNNYYALKNSLLKLDLSSIKGVDWRDFEATEYVTDLIYPYGAR
jgi:hypothetical protein